MEHQVALHNEQNLFEFKYKIITRTSQHTKIINTTVVIAIGDF